MTKKQTEALVSEIWNIDPARISKEVLDDYIGQYRKAMVELNRPIEDSPEITSKDDSIGLAIDLEQAYYEWLADEWEKKGTPEAYATRAGVRTLGPSKPVVPTCSKAP